MSMKLFSPLALLILLNASCTEECANPCLFEDEMRIDTVYKPFLDTLLIMGGPDAVIMYEDDAGGIMEFEVTTYEYDFPFNLVNTSCGDCGDSVLVQRHHAQFMYTMDNKAGLEIQIQMRSNEQILDDKRIFLCTIGEVSFIDNGASVCSQEFLAECNGFLTDEEGERLNGLLYNLPIDSSATLSCSPMDTTYAIDCGGSIQSFYMNDSIPISHFDLQGTCWHFAGTRPK